jgi:hypothetical protein
MDEGSGFYFVIVVKQREGLIVNRKDFLDFKNSNDCFLN